MVVASKWPDELSRELGRETVVLVARFRRVHRFYERLKLSVYGGGHMFYSRDASRRALREDARELYRAVEQAAAPSPRG